MTVRCETSFSFKQYLIMIYEIWFSAVVHLKCSNNFRLICGKTNSCAVFSCSWKLTPTSEKKKQPEAQTSKKTVAYININTAWDVLFGLKKGN